MSWREVARRAAQAAAVAEERRNGAKALNYRWEHVKAVVALALWLAEETGADIEVVEAAAWLHDTRKWEPKHAEAGARHARTVLTGTDFPGEKIERVVEAIAEHEGLTRETRLDGVEAAVLWDADKLTKLGATGELLARAAGYSVRPTLEETHAAEGRWLADLAPRIVASMNTEVGRAEAERRLGVMIAYHEALTRELALGPASEQAAAGETQPHGG